MQEYTLRTIEKGISHSFSVKLTDDMLTTFAHLTGDMNPLHTDDDFARQDGFPARVAHGMLVSSFYSTLVGMYLPGRHALLHGVDATLHNPAFVGDTLTVSGTVTYINEAFGQIEIKARVVNQDGSPISKAKIKAGVRA